MSSDLEDRLRTHLRQDDMNHASESGDLVTIRLIARKRSMRTRLAVGVCSLAAIVGAASLIPVRDGSNALVIADRPTETVIAERQVTEPTAETMEHDSEAAAEGAIGEPANKPPADRIIADGQGGFVAVSPTSRDGNIVLVRSTDGEEWVTAPGWQLPENHQLVDLREAQGKFVAIADRTEYTVPFGEGQPLTNPALAISPDLATWRWIELDLNRELPEREGRVGRHWIGDMAINGDRVAAVVTSLPNEALDRSNQQYCGTSSIDGDVTLLNCDGTIATDPSADLWGPPSHELLVLEPGEPPTVEETFAIPDFLSNGFITPLTIISVAPWQDGFRTIELGSSVSGLLENATTPGQAKPPFESQVRAAVGSNESLVAVVQDGKGFGGLMIEDTQSMYSPFPSEVVTDSEEPLRVQLDVGPAGWAALIRESGPSLAPMQHEGWFISGSLLPRSQITLESTDGGERYWLTQESTGLRPPAVQRSVFGQVRLYRPGTDDLLLSLTPQEAQDLPPTFVGSVIYRLHAPEPTLTVDGWTLSGNALWGPLVLTDPNGVETQFADGFAFTNGDTSDGVEIKLRSGVPNHFEFQNAFTPLQFFDTGGAVLVEFSGRDIYDEMIEPQFDISPVMLNPTWKSWIVYSADGVTWDVLQSTDATWQTAPSHLIVGDDEVIVVTRTIATRLPLDED